VKWRGYETAAIKVKKTDSFWNPWSCSIKYNILHLVFYTWSPSGMIANTGTWHLHKTNVSSQAWCRLLFDPSKEKTIKLRACFKNRSSEIVRLKNDQLQCIRIAVDRFFKHTLSFDLFWIVRFYLTIFLIRGIVFMVSKQYQARWLPSGGREKRGEGDLRGCTLNYHKVKWRIEW